MDLPRYLFSPLLGVVDLYLMLGSLLGICLVHYSVWLTCTLCVRKFTRYLFSPLLGVVDLYLMLGSLLGICLVHYSVWLTCTLC